MTPSLCREKSSKRTGEISLGQSALFSAQIRINLSQKTSYHSRITANNPRMRVPITNRRSTIVAIYYSTCSFPSPTASNRPFPQGGNPGWLARRAALDSHRRGNDKEWGMRKGKATRRRTGCKGNSPCPPKAFLQWLELPLRPAFGGPPPHLCVPQKWGGIEGQRGSSVTPIRASSTARAHWRPSRMAQTTRLWPRRMSPQAKMRSTEVR